MDEENSSIGDDVETARRLKKLDAKQQQGAVHVVNQVLNQPEVQEIIKKNISKQTFISGLFMSFLIIGLFTIVNVIKTVAGYDWRGDAILGTVFVAIGGVYMVRQMFPVKIKVVNDLKKSNKTNKTLQDWGKK